jgi:hypothetical protein
MCLYREPSRTVGTTRRDGSDQLRKEKRRLRAALPVIENGNAKAFRFVGEIAGDAGAGEDDDAGGHDLEHAVVALERSRLAVGGPVGLEGDLRHLAVIGPAGGGFLGAFRRAAMDQHHVGMLGVDLVEHGPDQLGVGVVGAAGKRDLGAFGQEQFGIGPAMASHEGIADATCGAVQDECVVRRVIALPPSPLPLLR